MKTIRWYDKNPVLKEVFKYIQKLDKQTQDEIAKDIIQILMNDISLNSDGLINSISSSYNYTCNRWYDNNIDLFSAFEIIKTLPETKQIEISKKIVESALMMHFKKD